MQALLRSVWDEPASPDPPPRTWRDWALVAGVAAAVLIEGVVQADKPGTIGWMLLGLALTPTLLWRRSHPRTTVAIAFLTMGVATWVMSPMGDLNTIAYLLILPYSLVRWGSGRQIVTGAAALAVGVGLCIAADTSGVLSASLSAVAVLGGVAALGLAFRYRASARVRELDKVKLMERERLARDLHDTVAHHVSAMAIRAQAGLATAGADPDAPVDALRVIEAEASRTLNEMRAMVRVLRRNEPAERAPSPRVADLAALVAADRAGPPVHVQLSGDLDDLPEPVGAAIYRLAQESVTNARRHARDATEIHVRVAADDSLVHLQVSDDGATSPAPNGSSPGYGLIGMIERAHLLGGTCAAGPNLDRGWTVTATLPRTGA
ncbi:MAG TPA: histidine kinase, partial [Acidimicrobiales bacterium]